jgi:hypothetical protein
LESRFIRRQRNRGTGSDLMLHKSWVYISRNKIFDLRLGAAKDVFHGRDGGLSGSLDTSPYALAKCIRDIDLPWSFNGGVGRLDF